MPSVKAKIAQTGATVHEPSVVCEIGPGAQYVPVYDKAAALDGSFTIRMQALDVRPHPAEACFFLYLNARDDWPWTKGRERLGLLVGD